MDFFTWRGGVQNDPASAKRTRQERFDERSARIETGAHFPNSENLMSAQLGLRLALTLRQAIPGATWVRTRALGMKPSSMRMAPPEPLRRQGWQQRRYGNTCSQLQESQGSSPRRDRLGTSTKGETDAGQVSTYASVEQSIAKTIRSLWFLVPVLSPSTDDKVCCFLRLVVFVPNLDLSQFANVCGVVLDKAPFWTWAV